MAKKEYFNKDCFKRKDNNYTDEFLSAAFLRGIAFGKNVSAFEGKYAMMSIENQGDIILAIKKAYIDMSPRTFDKNESWWNNTANAKPNKNERVKTKEDEWQDAKNEVFVWLAEEFYTYFQNDSLDFVKWHKTICGEFLAKFKPILNKYGYDADKSLKYGKAQKIVNMTFKYLFCFDDAEKYVAKFNACHMPIDSYILKWYNDNTNVKITVAWSDLEKEQYYKLQENIKTILGEYNPFLAEFYIWAEYNR